MRTVVARRQGRGRGNSSSSPLTAEVELSGRPRLHRRGRRPRGTVDTEDNSCGASKLAPAAAAANGAESVDLHARRRGVPAGSGSGRPGPPCAQEGAAIRSCASSRFAMAHPRVQLRILRRGGTSDIGRTPALTGGKRFVTGPGMALGIGPCFSDGQHTACTLMHSILPSAARSYRLVPAVGRRFDLLSHRQPATVNHHKINRRIPAASRCSAGEGLLAIGQLQEDVAVARLIQRAPACEVVATEQSPCLVGVVARRPLSKPLDCGCRVRAAHYPHAIGVGARSSARRDRPGVVVVGRQPHVRLADAERVAPAGGTSHDHCADWLAPAPGSAQPDPGWQLAAL